MYKELIDKIPECIDTEDVEKIGYTDAILEWRLTFNVESYETEIQMFLYVIAITRDYAYKKQYRQITAPVGKCLQIQIAEMLMQNPNEVLEYN